MKMPSLRSPKAKMPRPKVAKAPRVKMPSMGRSPKPRGSRMKIPGLGM